MKAQVMKSAHRIAKQITTGTYAQRLSTALGQAWALVKEVKGRDVQKAKSLLMADKWHRGTERALAAEIVNAVGPIAMATKNNFIDSVCTQFVMGRNLSEKQAYWLAKYAVELAA